MDPMSVRSLKPVIPAVALGLGGVAIWARWIEPAWIETTFTELEWNGPRLRIVFLSDLHARPNGHGRTRRVVRRANVVHPDVVLIGGDFIEGLDPDPRKLAALEP